MASVKIVLRKKKKDDGSYPLAIRITKDRKTSYLHIDQSIQEEYWDAKQNLVRKSHPNSERLNNYLLKRLAEVNGKALELETQKQDVSSKVVKRNMKPAAGLTFIALAKQYLSNLEKSGKYNRLNTDRSRIKHFKEFLKGEDLPMKEITVQMLENYKAYLVKTRSISERTIMNHLTVIRTLFGMALAEDQELIRYYPFGRGKIRIKSPESVKIGLTSSEVLLMENAELILFSRMDHARNIWLMAFYFAGMRVSDVLRLKWSDFHDERLHYIMGKNEKVGSLKIPEKAAIILQKYKATKDKSDLVFPYLKTVKDFKDKFEIQRKIAFTVANLNKSLKQIGEDLKIDKKLTLHIARHTFGNISGDKISIQMLQKLYRHSSITTSIGYQASFIHKDADDALDAVLGM
jgi:site-specific recombinase XerD